MTKKKFIGGGFPAIRECIDENETITKESREKREFSVRKIIPINHILSRSKSNYKIISSESESENLNKIDSIQYSNINSILHDITNMEVNNLDINKINGPLRKNSRKINSRKKRNN
jgi:hypothetical protein